MNKFYKTYTCEKCKKYSETHEVKPGELPIFNNLMDVREKYVSDFMDVIDEYKSKSRLICIDCLLKEREESVEDLATSISKRKLQKGIDFLQENQFLYCSSKSEIKEAISRYGEEKFAKIRNEYK